MASAASRRRNIGPKSRVQARSVGIWKNSTSPAPTPMRSRSSRARLSLAADCTKARTFSPGTRWRTISPNTHGMAANLPGQSAVWWGQLIHVASCFSHSAGKRNPRCAGVLASAGSGSASASPMGLREEVMGETLRRGRPFGVPCVLFTSPRHPGSAYRDQRTNLRDGRGERASFAAHPRCAGDRLHPAKSLPGQWRLPPPARPRDQQERMSPKTQFPETHWATRRAVSVFHVRRD